MGSHPLVRNNSNQSKRSTIDRKLAFRLGLTALLFAAILALALHREFYTESMTSAFLSLALASSVIVLGMIRRSWFDLLWVLTGSLFLAVLDYRVMDFSPVFIAGFLFSGLVGAGGFGC